MANPEAKRHWLQKGLWDRLFCEVCETHLSKIERKSAAQLRYISSLESEDGEYVRPASSDIANIRLLALSILWRSHVSTMKTFDHVNIGPIAEVIRQRLLKADPGLPTDFPVALIRIDGTSYAPTVMHAPHKTTFGDTEGWLILAMGYKWIIITDPRPDKVSRKYPMLGYQLEPQIPIMLTDDIGFLSEVRDSMPPALLDKKFNTS